MSTNEKINIGIVGLGLIGGSFALAIKNKLNAKIFGLDKYHFYKAKELNLIDEELKENKLHQMDIIIVATPVNTIGEITNWVLDNINDNCLVFDAGSIKNNIAKQVENHPKRHHFLLAHPIAGTEYSGPEAAFESLFTNKINILCDTHKTRKDLLQKAKNIFAKLQMKMIEMDSKEHDRHIAYVSHLSHVSSFMLGKTVMDLEKNEKNIFDMAGSGFASTVRLAKSSPNTWTPIFMENKENIIQSLDEYINNLQDFRKNLKNNEAEKVKNTLSNINYIKNIIDKLEVK